MGNCIDPTDIADSSYNGIAYGARIAVFDIGVAGNDVVLAMPDDLRDLFHPSYFAGARIHSNSWGGSYWYDSYSLETDIFAYDHPDFLVFFAGGNDGAERAVLSPALAKNAVGVAGSNQYPPDTMAPYSSWGPVFDGRIKPDITTPGTNIHSVSAQPEGSSSETCSLIIRSGTSMATPAAAASAALIRQYFEDPLFWAHSCNITYAMCSGGPFTPSGYLLKALLLHSGIGIKTPVGKVPDQHQGYGLVDLYSLLPLNNSNFSLFVDDNALMEFSQLSYELEVVSSETPLKVTLSWFDPPNTVFAAKVLLHDLDLLLITPSGDTLLGNSWVSNGLPLKGATRDELNNNEQITVTSPALGTWTVIVQAKLFTESVLQTLGLVITGDLYLLGQLIDKYDASKALQCLSKLGDSRGYPLAVSMMDFLHGDGWKDGAHYAFYDNYSIEIYSGTLQPGLFYGVDTVCLDPGTYTLSLVMTEVLALETTQLDIAVCGIFLSPLTRTQNVTIRGPSEVIGNNESLIVYDPSSTCVSQCNAEPHVTLNLLLEESNLCEGWGGAYFAFHDGSDGSDGWSGGTLEWGCSAVKPVCLPLKSQCYISYLYVPDTLKDYYPILGLAGAENCAYRQSPDTTVAMVCIDQDFTGGEVTFYSSHPFDRSVSLESWEEVKGLIGQSSEIGKCPIQTDLIIDGHNFSCLRNCDGFTDVGSFMQDSSRACNYLLNKIYIPCGTFTISRNMCPRPTCADSCSIEDWCYFGAALSVNCDEREYIPWVVHDENIMSIYSACMNAAVSDTANYSSLEKIIVPGISLIIIVCSVVVITIILFPSKQFGRGTLRIQGEDPSLPSEEDDLLR